MQSRQYSQEMSGRGGAEKENLVACSLPVSPLHPIGSPSVLQERVVLYGETHRDPW